MNWPGVDSVHCWNSWRSSTPSAHSYLHSCLPEVLSSGGSECHTVAVLSWRMRRSPSLVSSRQVLLGHSGVG